MSIPKNELPTNLTEAIDFIVKKLGDVDIQYIKTNDPGSVHFSFGMNIRNEFGLWDKKSPISIWFQEHLKIAHGDDLSGIILEMVWAKVKNKYCNPFEIAQKYREYWLRQSINPITGEYI